MNNTSGYRIHPSFQRQPSKDRGLVYLATYTVEDDKGVQGDPVTLSGSFRTPEEALAAAQQAGSKVLAQVQ
ncbi:MAG TPA: hypothetical protein VIM06_05660 [Rhodanobacter sp.]